MKPLEVVRAFFERQDAIAPQGGRKVESRELTAYIKANGAKSDSDLPMTRLAALCAAELGVELIPAK